MLATALYSLGDRFQTFSFDSSGDPSTERRYKQFRCRYAARPGEATWENEGNDTDCFQGRHVFKPMLSNPVAGWRRIRNVYRWNGNAKATLQDNVTDGVEVEILRFEGCE